MALADIIRRIDGEARQSASLIESEAAKRAEQARAAAEQEAQALLSDSAVSAAREASAQSATLLAAARLGARDQALQSRRELVERALVQVVAELESLPTEQYAHFIGARVAATVHGDEKVVVGADAELADLFVAEVERAKPGAALTVETDPSLRERGVVLVGDRVRSVISPASVVAEQRDELELRLASLLFSGEA